MTTGVAVTKDTRADAAVLAVLSRLDGIFTLKIEEQRTALEAFFVVKDVFALLSWLVALSTSTNSQNLKSVKTYKEKQKKSD